MFINHSQMPLWAGPVQSANGSTPLVDSYFVGGLRKNYAVMQDRLWHVMGSYVTVVKLACCQGVPRVSRRGGVTGWVNTEA